MISVFPTRSVQGRYLVSSDQRDRQEAHREIAQWAAQHALTLPRHPRRLALVEDDNVLAEWIVIEQSKPPEPPPPARLRTLGHLTVLPGGRFA